MKDGNDSPQISTLLKDKQSIAICLPTQTTLDAAASALALYQSLQQLGKSVSISSSEPLNPEFNLLGQENIKNTISADGDVLVVSIPFKDNGVENVTYNVENDKVNIVIKPEEGAQRFDPKQVEYSFSGGKPEVVITVYTPSFDSLGELYAKNIDQFQGVTIVNIDRHFTNAQYGTINVVDKRSPAMSLMILDILKDMKIEISKEIATMLFAGLSSATNNFTSHSVNAQTFKAAALLLERGAEKRPVKPLGIPMNGFKPYPSPGFGDFGQQPMPPMQSAGGFQPFSQPQPQFDQGGFAPMPFPSQSPMPQPTSQAYDSALDIGNIREEPVNEDQNQSIGTVEFKEATLPKITQRNNNQNQTQNQNNQHKQSQNQNTHQNQNSNQNPNQNKGEKPAQDWLKPQIFNNQQGNSRV